MNRIVRKILIALVVLGALSYGLGYYAGGMEARSPGSITGGKTIPLALIGLVLVASIVGMWITVVYMRAIDEAAREAHKWAWFWGGSGGMAAGLAVALLASVLPGAETWALPSFGPQEAHPAAYMAFGAALMAITATVGYAIAWVVWWLKRR